MAINEMHSNELLNKLKVFINLTIGLSALISAMFFIMTLPILTNPKLVPIIIVVLAVVLKVLSKYTMRNQFGKLFDSSAISFGLISFLVATLYGGMSGYLGMIFYLIPLLWLAAFRSVKLVVLSFVTSIIPELILLYNYMELHNAYIPYPQSAVGEITNWNVFWTQWGINASIVFLIPLQIAILNANAVSKRKKQLIEDANSKNVSESENISQDIVTPKTDISDDLKKLENENSSLREIRNNKHSFNGIDYSEIDHVLSSLVYFASGVYSAHSVLVFVLSDNNEYVLESKFSRSKQILDDAKICLGQGLIGTSFLEKTDFITGNLSTYSEEIEYYNKTDEVASVMASRIVDDISNKELGVIVVDSKITNKFNNSHLDSLRKLTEIAAKIISNVNLSAQISQSVHKLDLVYEVTKNLSDVTNVRGVVEVISENLLVPFNAKRVVVCDISQASGKGRIINIKGEQGKIKSGAVFPLENEKSVYASVLKHNHAFTGLKFKSLNRCLFTENLGETDPEDVLIAPLLDSSGKCVVAVGLETDQPGVFNESTMQTLQTILLNASSAVERVRLFQKLERQASFDGLTKIPNHRSFQDTLTKKIYEAKQNGSRVSMLLMDIDHFKNFNDTYGHSMGDRVLKEVAKVLKDAVREQDFAARYGGEEFVAILHDADEQMANSIAERVRKMISDIGIFHQQDVLSVTVSVGVSTYPEDTIEQQELIDFADQAMYHSKEGGRNRCTAYNSIKGLV